MFHHDWQSALPPFSQRVFGTAPHLGLKLSRRGEVEAPSFAAESDQQGPHLPSWLVLSLAPHRESLLALLKQWRLSGLNFVALGSFADTADRVCRLQLTDRELFALMYAIDPSRKEPLALRQEPLELALLIQLLSLPPDVGPSDVHTY